MTGAVALGGIPTVERSPHILVVDDEPPILDVVTSALRLVGYRTSAASTGTQALHIASSTDLDLIVLDVMLPDRDGFSVLQRLRDDGHDVPVLFLTARTGSEDATDALRRGGDDYVRKPFALEELVARVRVILRRTGRQPDAEEVLAYRDIVVDLARYEVRRGDRTVDLTPTERRMTEVLVRNGGRILTRTQIVDLVWDTPGAVDTTSIESVVSRLRRKLDGPGEEPLLVTRRGVGYGLMAPPD